MRRPLWLRVSAGLVILGSAVRLLRIAARRSMPDLLGALRAPRAPLRGSLADPELLAAGVDRLLPWLARIPPRRFGPCLLRSLLLVDLLGRCGRNADLHCGVRRRQGRSIEGHAWITIDGRYFAGQPPLPDGYVETWRA